VQRTKPTAAARDRRAPPATRTDVWRRYGEYLAMPPEVVVEWQDRESDARGWLVINSLRGGAAGGGTRMRTGLDREEVMYLAKIMELKFAFSGPPMGGAKSGIAFDPTDSRKADVLGRWFKAINPYLRSVYGTAGDLNVDESREVLPICRRLGLAHPQEGALRGHLSLEGSALERRLEAMTAGLEQTVGDPFASRVWNASVSDLVTGYGVAAAARRLLGLQGRTLDGARVLVEGFGCVGGGAALYLTRWGARIVGIIDVESGLVASDGLGEAEVEDLLGRRRGNRLPLADPESGQDARREFRRVAADVFVSAAASGTLTAKALEAMELQGVQTIVCGSNHPFASLSPSDTALQRDADTRFAVVADFIANLGAAYAFGFQMQRSEPAPYPEFFQAVGRTVEDAVEEAVVRAGSADRGLLAAALDLGLERIGHGGLLGKKPG